MEEEVKVRDKGDAVVDFKKMEENQMLQTIKEIVEPAKNP